MPWGALETGVLMEQEIGHAEVCHILANKDTLYNTRPLDTSDTHRASIPQARFAAMHPR